MASTKPLVGNLQVLGIEFGAVTRERIKRGTPFSNDRNPQAIRIHSEWLRGAVANHNGSSALDVGCGQGVHERTLLEGGCASVVGVDVSVDSLALCRSSSSGGEYVNANAEIMPFRKDSFDSAIVVEVIEHVDNVEDCLREIHRVLAPGGVLLITAPNRGFPFLTHGITIRGTWLNSLLGLPFPLFSYLPKGLLKRIWSARCYTAREFTAILDAAGFRVKELVFLMPSFDGVLPVTSRVPDVIMKRARSLSNRFNSTEPAWFGCVMAVTAVNDSKLDSNEFKASD